MSGDPGASSSGPSPGDEEANSPYDPEVGPTPPYPPKPTPTSTSINNTLADSVGPEPSPTVNGVSISPRMRAIHSAINKHSVEKKSALLEQIEAKRLLVQQLDPTARATQSGILQIQRSSGKIELSDTFPDQSHLVPGQTLDAVLNRHVKKVGWGY